MKTAALLFALYASGLAAQQLPPAPKAHLVEINPKPGFFNEPAIAVNPANPQQLVVAWQINASAAYSTDAGRSWTIAEGTAPKDYRVSGDVSLAYDASGAALLCYIAFDKLGTTNYWAHGATRNGIFVRRSPDGGKTWDGQAATVIAHASTPGIPFEDKPWIVADTSDGPDRGNLYVGWTQFTLSESNLLFAHSTDGGKTWSKPIQLNSSPGLPRDDNGALEGFHGVVGPDGTLYTIWDSREGIIMAVSRDGGLTFSKDRRIIAAGPGYFGITGVSRSNGFPQIAIDPRSAGSKDLQSVLDGDVDSNDGTGVNNHRRRGDGHLRKNDEGGNLYVAWSDYTNGDVDAFVASSSDHGVTWSAPVRVNNDAIHNGADQFFQWMAVDPQIGAVNLVFYDRRPDNQQARVTLARSTDGGKSFSNYTLDKEEFEAEGDFLGDYLAITAFGNKTFAAWAHQTDENAKSERGRKTRTVLRVGTADFN